MLAEELANGAATSGAIVDVERSKRLSPSPMWLPSTRSSQPMFLHRSPCG
jgi:hypothetical protein